jgi:hypothetical protein
MIKDVIMRERGTEGKDGTGQLGSPLATEKNRKGYLGSIA